MDNGTIFNNDTPQDMQELIDVLNKISSEISSISKNSNETIENNKKSKSGSISPTPSVSDLKSYVGNLGLVVPAGFIMLHNDLEKLIEGKSSGGATSGGSSGLSSLLSTGGAAAIGGAAGAAVGGLVTGLVGAFKPDSPGQKHIEELIDQMNANLTLEEVSSWPGIKEAQAEGVSAYVKTYFISQAAALATSEVIGSIGEGAGKVIAGVFTGIWKGFGGKEKTGLETITAKLMENLNPDDYINKPEILEAEEKGISAYVKTYFISQAAALATSEVLGSIGEGAGKVIAGVFTGIWKGFGGKEKTGIEGLVNEIIDKLDYETVIQDEDVQDAVHDNFVAYLKTYFAIQIGSMALSETVSGITELVGTAVGGVLKGLFKGIGEAVGIDMSTPIQKIINELIANINVDDYLNDNGVKAAETYGIVSYLKTYFEVQGKAMSMVDTAEAAGEAKGGQIRSFFTSILKKSEASPFEQAISDIINDIDADDFKDSQAIKVAKSWGLETAIKATTTELGINLALAVKDAKYTTNEVKNLKTKFVNTVGSAIENIGDTLNVDITNNTKTIASSFDDSKIIEYLSMINNTVENSKNYLVTLSETTKDIYEKSQQVYQEKTVQLPSFSSNEIPG